MSAALTLGNLAGVVEVRADESALTAELQAGSEEAFSLLIAQYHASVYSVVSRLLKDPSDAADITQDVFVKVFRGIRSFHGDSTLRTWIYRIAIREASNQRRWWFRHRGREVTIDTAPEPAHERHSFCMKDMLVDQAASPFEMAANQEIRARVDSGIRHLPEPFRTVIILRDLEGMSYDEVAEILGVQLGTVKSRLVRGRAMLREQLRDFVAQTAARPVSCRPVRASASVEPGSACKEVI